MCVVSIGAYPDIEHDPELPTLRAALDPVTAERALKKHLPVHPGAAAPMRLRSIRVLAWKPRRRCLIEYGIEVSRADGSVETLAVLGKIRAHRFGNSGYRQLRDVWNAGFTTDSPDGISVPEPLATIPKLRMWLQKKVPGHVATHVLSGPEGVSIAARIADAVQKLHTAGVRAHRRHTMDDELWILEGCLQQTATIHGELGPRISRLIDACGRVGLLLPEPLRCGSHRDFYADQVLVSERRLFIIDFDLYCEADPGLDIGNFLGHLTEQALRQLGNAGALNHIEQTMEDRFVTLAGEDTRWAVRVYAALTVARHVYLSTRLPDRARLTPALLALAEQRLQLVAAEGGHA